MGIMHKTDSELLNSVKALLILYVPSSKNIDA